MRESNINNEDVPISEMTKDPTVKRNLIIFICAWIVTTFNNFLL